MNHIKSLLRSGDFFAAVEHIQRQGTPLEIADAYQALVRDLYWKTHDLQSMIIIGRAGILYCLGQSLAPGVDASTVDNLRSKAKAMSYNVGSFTWPGWEEPGINPTPEDLAFGVDCARLNLRLAIELKKPADRVAAAYWLVGAHALAAREFATAASAFQQAHDLLPLVDEAAKVAQLMYQGYIAVAAHCLRPSEPDAKAQFEHVVAQLAANPHADAESYRTQLLSAFRLFVPA